MNAPEACAEALGQLGHDGVALVLDGTEGGQVPVVAQHSAGAGMAAQGPCRLRPRPAPQPPRHLHQRLQLPQQRLHPCKDTASVAGTQREQHKAQLWDHLLDLYPTDLPLCPK